MQGARPPGDCADHRDAQPLLQQPQIRRRMLAARLIHQVDAYHHAGAGFHGLQHQVKVALYAGGIAHHHNGIRPAETDVVAGNLLLGGMSHQGIGAGDIHQQVAVAVLPAGAAGVRHSFARPVAGVLVHAGQGIEYGAFPHIRIAGQGNHPFVRAAAPDVR